MLLKHWAFIETLSLAKKSSLENGKSMRIKLNFDGGYVCVAKGFVEAVNISNQTAVLLLTVRFIVDGFFR